MGRIIPARDEGIGLEKIDKVERKYVKGSGDHRSLLNCFTAQS
jgi:hypothetical protein